jgi:hypothetical protein
MGYYYTKSRCFGQGAFHFSDEQKANMLIFYNGSRSYLKNLDIISDIEKFHAGKIRKAKCDVSPVVTLSPMKDVTVNIESNMLIPCKTLKNQVTSSIPPTSCEGHYIGKNDWISTGIQKILPYKNDDPINGVTTADIVSIQKHILGTQLLTSAYQLIAADVNNSGTISTADIIHIRKLILGINTSLPTPSWRFLSEMHEKEMSKVNSFNDDNPFQNNYKGKNYLISTINGVTMPSYLDHVDIDYSKQNEAYDPFNWSFRGIKMGDVNCNAMSLLEGEETPDVFITTKNNFELIPPNKTLVVNVLLNKDVPVEAYQMELAYDENKVHLLRIEQGDDSNNSLDQNSNIAEEGKIRTLWYSQNENKLDSKAQYSLFKLYFRTTAEIQNPNELLHLSKDGFHNVFYNTNMQASNVNLTFLATEVIEGGSSKIQKTKPNIMAFPNPTNSEFYLNVPLAASGKIIIQVTDVLGKILKNMSVEGIQGQNEVLINNLNLSGQNMLHYNILCAEGNYQGKIFVQN